MMRARGLTLLPLLLAFFSAGCGERSTSNTVPKNASAPPPAAVVEPERNPEPDPRVITWETYHGGASLAGYVELSLPEALSLAWKADVGNRIMNTPVSDGRRVYVADTKGTLHAYDMHGQLVWTKTFYEPAKPGRDPRPVGFDAPIALFDSTLLACTSTGIVYALDSHTGEVRWTCDTEWPILGTPNVATVNVDGKPSKRVYVIDEMAGGLQCIDFASGEKIWSGESVDRCDGSPAVSDTYVVYGSCACAIHVFSSETGKMIREIPLDDESQIAGGVALLGDSIFTGSRSGMFVHANASTGQTVWTNSDCAGESYATPAVSDNRVVFTASDSLVYCLDRGTGSLVWKKPLDGIPGSPIIAGEAVVVTSSGELYLMRLTDGEILWRYIVSDEITSPAITGTLILVGGDDGMLTAFSHRE
ncbi:MAG: hypothetical protein AMXMBFR84_35450 [Candidatus Hydrogenedentota bacterium]